MNNRHLSTLLATAALLSACSGVHEAKEDTQLSPGSECSVKAADVVFTRSINGASSLIVTDGDSLVFSSGAKTDCFIDPDGNGKKDNAPILLTKIDNTKPFTFTARVKPQFKDTDTYTAGALYVYANDTTWQKFAFEQDERGNHRLVTVRTLGRSDDNNHEARQEESVWMKISSDTKCIGSYYSVDGETWNLVRLYENYYPEMLYLGLSSQCPVGQNNDTKFSDIRLTQKNISNFRLGD